MALSAYTHPALDCPNKIPAINCSSPNLTQGKLLSKPTNLDGISKNFGHARSCRMRHLTNRCPVIPEASFRSWQDTQQLPTQEPKSARTHETRPMARLDTAISAMQY